MADHRERIAAARAAAEAEGVRLFINARIDTYLLGVGHAAARPAATLERALAYLDAGADGIFVPGLLDPAIIATLAEAIAAPLNIMAGPGAPAAAELARIGVRRVSLGTALAQLALTATARVTSTILETGAFHALADAIDFTDANALFAPAR